MNLGKKLDITLVEWRCYASYRTVNKKDPIRYLQLIANIVFELIVKENI